MKKILYRVLVIVLAVSLFLGLSSFLGKVLMPVRKDYGSTWESYLQEPENSIDVLFFGSSIVYCDVIPAVIYEKTGLTSYLMAGPEMTMPVAYFYVREACKTQQPQAVVVEVTALYYPRYTSYTKTTIGYMPWSLNRLRATFEAAEKEERFGLLFPLYNYHYCLPDLDMERLSYHLSPEVDPYAGYTPLDTAEPQGEIALQPYDTTGEYERNLSYLQKIGEFCQENDIKLFLYAAPAKTRISPELIAQLREDLTPIPHREFVDFNSQWDASAIDDETDWYDFLHFNTVGAKKFSADLAEYLTDLGLTPSNRADTALWNDRIAAIG